MRKLCAGVICLAFAILFLALPNRAEAQVNRHIYFFNECRFPVRLFVYHQHANGNWATHGWFNIRGNAEPTRLEYSNGSPLVHIDGRPLYFYAETTSGTSWLWEGSTRAEFNGVRYGLDRAMLLMEGGQMQFGINCNQAADPAPPVASTPNANLTPLYGTINLNAGFLPDPRTVSLQAGGSIPAERVGSNCRGYIGSAPHVRLNYQAGNTFPLIISASSSADTTLVIRGPDGRWYCDDDGGVNGLNPGLRFGSPMRGRYDIWVGTYSSGPRQNARLYISELESQ